MHSLGLNLLSHLAEGLGKNKDYFEPWFKEACACTFRSIHYLPRSHEKAADCQGIEESLQKLVTPEHTDSGFITLLTTFEYQGLQVEIDGEYKSIKPEPGCIIVNLGDTLEQISNNRIRATRHRVLDIGIERYSCPFFMDPKFSARVSTKILESDRKHCEDRAYDEAHSEEVIENFGKILCKKMTNAYGEWKGF